MVISTGSPLADDDSFAAEPQEGEERLLDGVHDRTIVFGHSHLPHNEMIGGVRFFNPASAGPRRFDYPVSVGMIEDGRAYHIALDERSVVALEKRMNQLR